MPNEKQKPAWYTEAGILTKDWSKFLQSEYDGFIHRYNQGSAYIFLNNDWGYQDNFDETEYWGVENNLFSLEHPVIKDLEPTKYWTPETKWLQEIAVTDDKSIQVMLKATEGESYSPYWKEYWHKYRKEAKAFLSKSQKIIEHFDSTYQEALKLNAQASISFDKLAEKILLVNKLPKFFKPKYQFFYDGSSKILQVNFEFPDYSDTEIVVGRYATGFRNKYASAPAKKKLIKNTLYSLIVWMGHTLAINIKNNGVEKIAINVNQSWHDPATGRLESGVIASVLADKTYLSKLNITKVDPVACFKQLKGLITPSLENQSPIRPIFEMNQDDKRLVKTKDIEGTLEEGTNLAAMDWEDFEHLVAQLFELQFSREGTKIKVTQASRDKGVDAIIFDPDPFVGGKYVIQAKRYTNTVDVSSVRDLYGTVLNEGANRGILITTSSYGSEAYEFAKDKPISLVDGPNLLNLFRQHGKKYRIDIDEAKKLFKEDA